MEFFVRLLLITVKLVALWAKLLSFLWTRLRGEQESSRLPPIENRLLTLSVQELRGRLRARQVRYPLIAHTVRLADIYIHIYYS